MINSEKIRNNWIFILVSQPQLYLATLIRNTIFIGVFTLFITYSYLNSSYNTIQIPTITHSLIGVAIGLMLVFRTQSAYERWSTASKNFYDMIANFQFFVFKIQIFDLPVKSQSVFKKTINNFTENLKNYLRADNQNIAHKYEKDYLANIQGLIIALENERKEERIDKSDVIMMEKIILDISIASASCAKIKKLPIPVSYEMHIKISIFFYILSLPFGLLHEMGMWSTLMVMTVYYIIAGIEIISKEIENPFHGDPNDLPIEKYFNKINLAALELKS